MPALTRNLTTEELLKIMGQVDKTPFTFDWSKASKAQKPPHPYSDNPDWGKF